jgi:hypothetical protein
MLLSPRENEAWVSLEVTPEVVVQAEKEAAGLGAVAGRRDRQIARMRGRARDRARIANSKWLK